MKQFKPVIITALVLVIACATAFLFMKLFPEIESGGTGIEVPDDFENRDRIIDLSATEIKSIEITDADGEYFVIDYSKTAAGVRHAAVRGDSLPYLEDELVTISQYLGDLTAFETVGESEDDALYGLDFPRRTIKLLSDNGERLTLHIGKDTPVGGNAYVRLEGNPTVYAVGETTKEKLLATRESFRNISLFDAPERFAKVTLERPGKPNLVVVRKDEQAPSDQIGSVVFSPYKIISPVERDASPDTIEAEFLDKISEIEPAALVEDNPSDLSKYGLDKPIKLSFTTLEERSEAILIGNKAPSGGRYVMRDGVNSVIVTTKDIDLVDINHSKIVSQLLWFFDSEEVKSLKYELPGGKTHTLELELKDNSIVGKYDGKTLEGKNATNLFLRTIRFTIAGEYSSDMTKGASAIKVSARLKNGESSTLELFPINDRMYAASIDGKAPQYYINVTEVRELLESFDLIAAGKEIPGMF